MVAAAPVHAQSSRLIECCAELGRRPSNQWGVCMSPKEVLIAVPIERKRRRRRLGTRLRQSRAQDIQTHCVPLMTFAFANSRQVLCGSGVTNASQQRSRHTNPLRSAHADRVSSAPSQIKRHAVRKRAAVIDCHRHGFAVVRIGDRHLRPESKRAMRGGQAACIEALATRRPAPRRIVGRNDLLSRTGSVRPGVREEPGKTAALGRRGRRDQRRRNQ
jgi:hypothetical protein